MYGKLVCMVTTACYASDTQFYIHRHSFQHILLVKKINSSLLGLFCMLSNVLPSGALNLKLVNLCNRTSYYF